MFLWKTRDFNLKFTTLLPNTDQKHSHRALRQVPSIDCGSTVPEYRMTVVTKASIASFGGQLLKLSHAAVSTKCEMNFNLYLPPAASQAASKSVPLLIYLSGLTCTADNCSEKGFFQHGASKKGIAMLYPDTSPSESFSLPLQHCSSRVA